MLVFDWLVQIANKVGALLMTDMAHFSGLVAAQVRNALALALAAVVFMSTIAGCR